MHTPKPVDLIIDARYIVPIEPAGTLVDYALVVDDGRIVALAPSASASVERDYVARARVALPTHLLIPGLVNAHTHAAMVLLRGIADDVPLKPWLEDHIWPREGRHVSPEFVADGTLHAAAEMLKGGITCASDIKMMMMSDHGLVLYGNAIMVNPDFAKANPKVVAGFVRATIKGARDMARDPELTSRTRSSPG